MRLDWGTTHTRPEHLSESHSPYICLSATLPCHFFHFFPQYNQTNRLRTIGYKYIVLYYFLT
ncbi:hypothetical protein CU280_10395 [Yersinia mollaretii]|nr:hypothetical protein CU280_10395 [Yersinia mollaretii]